MTQYFVSKESGASDANSGLSAAAPKLTIAGAWAAMAASDDMLLRAGDTWTENLPLLSSGMSGNSFNTTAIGSYGGAGNGKAKIIAPTPASQAPVVFGGGATYYELLDLEVTNNNFTDGGNQGNAVTGEHIIEINSGGATFVACRRCYFHHSANCIAFSNNGPAPRSSSATGTGSGDDSDWLFEDCELYAAGNSILIWHGSRLVLSRCNVHRWGESSYTPGKHGVYNLSPASVFDTCLFHNEDAHAGSFSGPSFGQPISIRVTGVKVKDCLMHDCNVPGIFWYDNIRGVGLFLRNRMWNMYGNIYQSAVTDTGPVYNWGPNPMDKFIFVNNVIHIPSPASGKFVDWSDTSSKYAGGLVLANNVFIGGYTYAIDSAEFAANNGFTGQLLETNNVWIATGTSDAGTFRFAGTARTLAQWKTAVIDSYAQGQGSFYTAALGLGSAPLGDPRRAPTPYQVLGVIQTPAANSLVSGTFGAPDYVPQAGSPVIDAGSSNVDPAIAFVAN